MKKKFAFALVVSGLSLSFCSGFETTNKFDRAYTEELEETEEITEMDLPQLTDANYVNSFFLEENDPFGLEQQLEDDALVLENEFFNDIDLDFDDINFDDIDLETINRFSSEPDFLDKVNFALQYLKLQSHETFKKVKTHVLENKDLYILGSTATAVVVIAIIVTTLLKKNHPQT